jgi:hypothetical protein
MGIDFYPGIYYGFETKNIKLRIYDIAHSVPDGLRHDSTSHVFGLNVSFEEYKQGKLPSDCKRLGDAMLKYFGIKCDYHMVLTGDVCRYCETPNISLRSWMRLVRPVWSLEECSRIMKEITGGDDDEDETDDKKDLERIKKLGLKPPFHTEKSNDESSSKSVSDDEETNESERQNSSEEDNESDKQETNEEEKESKMEEEEEGDSETKRSKVEH